MNEPTLPAAPAAPTAPAAPIDYAAKARAAYKQHNAPKTEPVVETKPELKAPEPKAEVKPAEPKAEVKPETKEKPPSDSIAKSFEKLAVEREALRQEKAAIEARASKLAAIESALASKDPRTLMALAGITHEDYVRAFTGAKAPEAEEAPKQAQPSNELQELRQHVQKLESMLLERQGQEQLSQVTAVLKSKLTELAPEFPIASKLGDEAVQEALDVMQDHYRRTKSMPSDDPTENFRLALAVVEEKHKALAKKYGFLTPPSAPATVGDEAPEHQPRVTSVALTNGDVSGPPGAQAQPKTPEEYRAQALKTLRKHSTAR